MDRIPKTGEIYRHFKDKFYQIVAIAKHSETGESLVIYQALYGTYGVYARPLAMFVSEVDHVKYLEVKQRYRFEKVTDSELQQDLESAVTENVGQNVEIQNVEMQNVRAARTAEQTEPENPAAEPESSELQQMTVNEKMMAFFDADDLEQKYNILTSMRDEITQHMINNMAVAMDVVIPDGELDTRYDALRACIQTKRYYERKRAR